MVKTSLRIRLLIRYNTRTWHTDGRTDRQTYAMHSVEWQN